MADLKVKVGIDKSGFTTGLASMENSVKGFGNKVGGILAGAFAFDKIIQGFSTAIEKGDQLQDLANRFGIAASSLQEIGNAASLSGAGLEDVASAMNKLAKNAGEAVGGNDAMAEAFAKIGLSVADLNGMSPQDLFMALSKAVASGSLGMQDFTVAMQLAGKGAGSLMETLRMGPEAIAANGQAMGVWSDETIRQLSEASDAMKSFNNQITIGQGNVAVFGNAAVSVFQTIIEKLTLMAAAAGKALTGDLPAAKEIYKAVDNSGIGAKKNPPPPTPRNMESAVSADMTESDKIAKAYKRAAENTQKTYERADEILRQNYLKTLSDSDKLVELLKEEAVLREKINKMVEGQDRASAVVESVTLNGQINDLRRSIQKDKMKSLKEDDVDIFGKEKKDRSDRLGIENRARGNAADFDPRAALMKRYGLGKQASDIPSSTEAKPIQPVKLENPPDLKGIMDKLDILIKNAGVFS